MVNDFTISVSRDHSTCKEPEKLVRLKKQNIILILILFCTYNMFIDYINTDMSELDRLINILYFLMHFIPILFLYRVLVPEHWYSIWCTSQNTHTRIGFYMARIVTEEILIKG